MELYLVGTDPQGEPPPSPRLVRADPPAPQLAPPPRRAETRNPGSQSGEVLVLLGRSPREPIGGGEAA